MSDSKPEAPLMIGVSGLRGIVGESLTPEVAIRFAGVFGAWLGQRGEREVVVARDGRANGPEVYEAAIEGLLRSGCNVTAAGIQMTPSVGCAIGPNVHGDAGLIVTASHNPQEWNGLKLLHDGAAPDSKTASEIIEWFHSDRPFDDPHRGECGEADGTLELHRVETGDAFRHVLGHGLKDSSFPKPIFSPAEPVLSAVVDSVNASGSKIVKEFFDKEVQVRLYHINDSDSGIFPHTPEPTAENLSGEGGLCDAVPGLKADVGFAQDPDGDRLAIVDETGRYIGEEYTLALCAVSILEARKAAGEPFGDVVLCANLSTSRMVDDIAATYGASVVRTAVGEANVVEAMKRLKREGKTVLLGGEGNGGVIWPEVTYVRDSLGSMALVLSLMARAGKTVSELVADLPSYAIVKRKQPLTKKEDAKPAIERIASAYASERVDTQDGVRIDFDAKRAWVHVRASNTEPILRLIAEAEDEAVANQILDEVAKLVGG